MSRVLTVDEVYEMVENTPHDWHPVRTTAGEICCAHCTRVEDQHPVNGGSPVHCPHCGRGMQLSLIAGVQYYGPHFLPGTRCVYCQTSGTPIRKQRQVAHTAKGGHSK